MTDNDIEEWFRKYLEVFSTLDVEAILPHYHSPMIVILPGAAIAMKDLDEVRNTFTLILSQYSASDYGRSEIDGLESRHLGEGLAEVGGRAIRYSSRGEELNSFLFRYVMRREGDTWRIVTMINGDPVPPST